MNQPCFELVVGSLEISVGSLSLLFYHADLSVTCIDHLKSVSSDAPRIKIIH
nr:MAG TPA: hypothetical protein [Caudoviricetes sp.]